MEDFKKPNISEARNPLAALLANTTAGEGGCLLYQNVQFETRPRCSITFEGRIQSLQSIAWQLMRGPLQEGRAITTTCRDPQCVAPLHLRLRWAKAVQTLDDLLERTAPSGNGCKLFTGAIHRSGYGIIRFQGKAHRAHRLAWSMVNGEIPQNSQIMHSCDTPACVNPEHLSLGNAQLNSDDMIRKGRQRHPATPLKLTRDQALEIYTIANEGSETLRSLAERFGVNESYVLSIKKRRRWQSLHEPSKRRAS